ncbi:MAG: alpha/beta hydrolase [Chromatocurvus sp.]
MQDWKLSADFDFEGRSVRHDRYGEGPPVVLVHGTPWSSYNLRHIINELSARFTVYYYDLVGYGQSSKAPGDVSLGAQSRLLAALLAHWELERPDVVAHDIGGATALRAHLLQHCALRRLVLINPVALAPWGSPFFRHVQRHEDAFSGLPDYIHAAVLRAYIGTAMCQPIDEHVLDATLAPWIAEPGKAAFYRQIAQADERYTDDMELLYPTISIPSAILWGREDAWIPLSAGQRLHTMIPGSTFQVVDSAGHLVIEEQPGVLTQAILEFLDSDAGEAS